jgi:predicted dehydrogenase
MKIACLEAGHWHAPLYVQALADLGAPVCCWSESDPEARERRRGELPGLCHASYQDLLEADRPDLVLAFGSHDRMPALAADLVAAGVPFTMEKPMGLDPAALEPVVLAAEQRGLFAGADLVMRWYPIFARLGELRDQGRVGRIHSFRFSLLAGGPERYLDWGCPWMLEPQRSGGPLFNFGPHGVDLFLWLTGATEAEVIAAACVRDLHPGPLDDYVTFTLRTPDGALGVFEVGYVLPGEGGRQDMTLIADRLGASSPDGAGGTILWREDAAPEAVAAADGRHVFLAEVLRRVQAGEPAPAPARDMLNVLRVLRQVADMLPSARGA